MNSKSARNQTVDDTARPKARLGIVAFLLALVFPLLLVFAFAGYFVVTSQADIRKQSRQALEINFPVLLDRQRSSVNIERLAAMGEVVYYCPDSNKRREVRLDAQALIGESDLYTSSALRPGLKSAFAELRNIAKMRDRQDDLRFKITTSRVFLYNSLWEFQVDAPPDKSAIAQQLRYRLMTLFLAMNSAFTQQELEASIKPVQGLLDDISQLMTTRNIFADNPEQREKMKETLSVVPQWCARQIEYEAAVNVSWQNFNAQVDNLRDDVFSSLAISSDGILQSVLRSAKKAEWATAIGAICLVLFFIIAFIMTQWNVVRPILWISHALEKVHSGGELGTIPRVFILELQRMADVLTDFSLYLRYVAAKSEHLESELQKYEDLSFRDALTGIYNRRYFDLALTQELEVAKVRHSAISIVMLDVDFFKKYNDTYGHPTGDECLKAIAKVLLSSAHRPNDRVIRYGGEEFVILLPGVMEEGALQVSARIHDNVRRLSMKHSSSTISDLVTVSIGVAVSLPHRSDKNLSLIEMADRALYAAKSAGRDRTCVYSESMKPR